MACSKCTKEHNCHDHKNNSNWIFIVIILYILLAIVLGGRMNY